MMITENSMTTYEFGCKKIWPKPELKTPFEIINHYQDLLGRLGALESFLTRRGREDHMIKNLDTLAFSLKEALFRVIVLREAIAGSPVETEPK